MNKVMEGLVMFEKKIPNKAIDELVKDIKEMHIPIMLGRSHRNGTTTVYFNEDFLFLIGKLKPIVIFSTIGVYNNNVIFHFNSQSHTYRLSLEIKVKKQ